jgi:hypothetical protein
MKSFYGFIVGANVVCASGFAVKHDWGWLMASLTTILWCGTDILKAQ